MVFSLALARTFAMPLTQSKQKQKEICEWSASRFSWATLPQEYKPDVGQK
jgi:hypothetical protein